MHVFIFPVRRLVIGADVNVLIKQTYELIIISLIEEKTLNHCVDIACCLHPIGNVFTP